MHFKVHQKAKWAINKAGNEKQRETKTRFRWKKAKSVLFVLLVSMRLSRAKSLWEISENEWAGERVQILFFPAARQWNVSSNGKAVFSVWRDLRDDWVKRIREHEEWSYFQFERFHVCKPSTRGERNLMWFSQKKNKQKNERKLENEGKDHE